MNDGERDELEPGDLERAGRALRDSVADGAGPTDRVRTRARDLVRHRRIAIASSVAAVVIATSIGIGFAARGGNGLGVHTIPPADSSTTSLPLTTDVRPTVPNTTTPREVDPGLGGMPQLSFANRLVGWRVDPLVERGTVERTSDGGRTWTVQVRPPSVGDSVNGVLAVDDRDAYAVVTYCCDNTQSQLLRTTDGVHWKPTAGAGLAGPIGFVSFLDPSRGWGLTRYGDLVATTDAGDRWRALAQPDPHAAAVGVGRVGSVCVAGPRTGWAATGTAVYRSDDDGVTWQRQLTIPVGGAYPGMACNGAHVAFASFDVGAGQHIGAFMRSDDGGVHWRPLTEDLVAGTTSVTAPGFPDSQYRGYPALVLDDGTLVFTSGSSAEGQNWVVTASLADHFVVGKFDSTALSQIVLRGATASDSTHLFAETQTVTGDGTGPRPVTLYASTDGGHTWTARWTGQ